MTLDMTRPMPYNVSATTHGHNSIGNLPAKGIQSGVVAHTDTTRGGLLRVERRPT